MEKAIISSSKAPAAIGPYSQAVIGNGTLYVSGQLPIDPATGVMPEDLKAQVAQSMKNIIALVKAAGMCWISTSGAGKLAGNWVSTRCKATGPPVEVPIATSR